MRVMSLSTRIAQTKEIYYNYFQNLASATHNSCEGGYGKVFKGFA